MKTKKDRQSGVVVDFVTFSFGVSSKKGVPAVVLTMSKVQGEIQASFPSGVVRAHNVIPLMYRIGSL